MIRWFIGLCMLFCAASATAQTALFSGRPASVADPVVTAYNILDYATCNGIVDDTVAIHAWRDDVAIPQQAMTPGLIQVNIPAGHTCCALNNLTMAPADRLVKVRFVGGDRDTSGFSVVCNGVTGNGGITLGSDGANKFVGGNEISSGAGICQHGLTDSLGCSARLNEAHVGDTTITLSTASCMAGYVSRFPVGQWVVVGGYLTQISTFPPNNQFFDYGKVTNVASCTITLDRPLTYNYLTTWPNPHPGGTFSADYGGPATVWNMNPFWDTEVEYRNLTLLRIGNPMNSTGKQFTFRDMSFGASDYCLTPSQNLLVTFVSVLGTSCGFENDKFVERTVMTNSTFDYLSFQSGGANKYFDADNLTVRIMNGSSYIVNIANSTFTSELKAGSFAYGRSKSFSCTDCSIHSITSGGPYTSDIETGFSMTSGVMTYTAGFSNDAANTFTPGSNVFWIDGSDPVGVEAPAFQITDVYEDGGGLHAVTTLTGQTGFPSLPKSSTLGWHVAPVEVFTCVRCTGSEAAISLSTAACSGRPLFSCYSRAFTGSLHGALDSIGTAGDPNFTELMWGNLTSLTMAVASMQNFTGTGGQLDWSLNRQLVRASGATCNYIPTINLSQVGTRVITPSGATGNQSGDGSLTIALFCTDANAWFHGNPQLYASRDVSGQSSSVWPTVTFTLLTDQGIVPASP